MPRVGDAVLTGVPGQPDTTVSMPAFFSRKADNVTFRVPVTIPIFGNNVLRIAPDDCVTAISVNGKMVPSQSVSFCGAMTGMDVDLSGYLQHGENVLTVSVRDTGGLQGLKITFARDSWYFIFLLWAIVVCIFALACLLLEKLRYRVSIPVAGVMLAGVLVRVFYAITTSPFLRAYDAWGHREYIQYMLENWSLPLAEKGWEFYHPPLYFFLAALWAKMAIFLGMSENGGILAAQQLSFLISVGILLLFLLFAMRLFADPQKQALFLCIPATIPSIVFFSARLNNDALTLLLSMACLYGILRWWQTGSIWLYLLGAVFLGFAALTKSTAFLLLPLLFILPFLLLPRKKKKPWKQVMVGGIAILLIAGWFHIPRFLKEGNAARFLVRNVVTLNTGLHVPNTPSALLTFNPVEVLRHPYNNTWADAERRMNFPEFLYRSAFLGEFGAGENLRIIVQQILAIGMALFCVSVWGMILDLRKNWRTNLPLLLAFVSALMGHFAFRILSSFSPSQDFRYSAILLCPLCFYLLRGTEALPKPLRTCVSILIVVLALQSLLILLSLPSH